MVLRRRAMKAFVLAATAVMGLAPVTARAQLQEMRQTIFGMD
jgi:hypothetical protein